MASINAVSFAGLAHRLGVTRQRIYNLHKAGKLYAYQAGDGKSLVIPAKEADRIADAVVHVKTAKGTRVVFNFI